MYIKLKHIKQFLLIMACFFLAGFNYLTYAKAEDTTTICDKSIDSDCDGLTNAEEKLYGTNASNADTDGDGYSDGVEVKSGYDPTIAAPGDRIEVANSPDTSTNQNIIAADTTSLTDEFSQSISSLVTSKGDQPISTSDINTLVDEQLAKTMGEPISWDTLPEIDRSKIKVLKQDYSNLNSTEKKEKLSKDAYLYIQKMGYLLVSNAPTPVLSAAEFSAFQDDFLSHLTDLANSNGDDEYFSDLGNRLEIFLNQTDDIEVPETVLDLHIKFLRLVKGVLTLRDFSQTGATADPMGKMLIFNKSSAYINLFSAFFQNDFQNYFNNLK